MTRLAFLSRSASTTLTIRDLRRPCINLSNLAEVKADAELRPTDDANARLELFLEQRAQSLGGERRDVVASPLLPQEIVARAIWQPEVR